MILQPIRDIPCEIKRGGDLNVFDEAHFRFQIKLQTTLKMQTPTKVCFTAGRQILVGYIEIQILGKKLDPSQCVFFHC